MPESLIPVVAIIQGRQAGEIAVGTIVGAPFLLAALTMAVSGAAAVIFRARRGSARLQPDRNAISRDLLVGAAELFVTSIEHLAHGLGADQLILTLVIAPLATELPEKVNSVAWIRQG
jgi:Ca2+/Na+ antiporter